jgi:hypothetical protein
MTIDEAVKLQTELLSLLSEVGFDKYKASTRLGIEALKLVKYIRTDTWLEIDTKLPGETEE